MLSKKIWICVAVLLITSAVGTAAAIETTSDAITAKAGSIGLKITPEEVISKAIDKVENVESKLTPEKMISKDKKKEQKLAPKEQLGELIFFDANLSTPTGQACEDCHGKDVGWTGPNEASNVLRGGVYHGANVSRFGNRKPPTIAYSTFAPNFRLDNATTGAFVGGEFWDGRATGEIRGTAAADQATGPFLNPLEMNNSNGDVVVDKVCTSSYADLFKQVWGKNACDDKKKAFDDIAFSIVAFEASKEVSPFTSKYDAYLDGKVKLTDKEMKGLELFKGKAICDNCHIADLGPDGKHPLFTNFIYGDPGTPRNPQNPFYNLNIDHFGNYVFEF
jgi:cytochrome c peroxidase